MFYFEKFVPQINAVTSADVDVAVRHLDPSRLTTLVVGDYSTCRPLTRLKLRAAAASSRVLARLRLRPTSAEEWRRLASHSVGFASLSEPS